MFNEHNLNLSEFVLQGLFPNILPAGKSVHAPVNVGASTPSTTCKFHQAAAVATGRKTMYSMHMYDHILYIPLQTILVHALRFGMLTVRFGKKHLYRS